MDLPVASNKTSSLRKLYDAAERHLRILSALSEDVEQPFFVSLLTSKLPRHSTATLEMQGCGQPLDPWSSEKNARTFYHGPGIGGTTDGPRPEIRMRRSSRPMLIFIGFVITRTKSRTQTDIIIRPHSDRPKPSDSPSFLRFLQGRSLRRPVHAIQNRRRTQVGDWSKPVFSLLTSGPFNLSMSRHKQVLLLRKSIPPQQFMPNEIFICRTTRNSSPSINHGGFTRRHHGVH